MSPEVRKNGAYFRDKTLPKHTFNCVSLQRQIIIPRRTSDLLTLAEILNSTDGLLNVHCSRLSPAGITDMSFTVS